MRRSIYLWTVGMVDVNRKGSIFLNDKKTTYATTYYVYWYMYLGIHVHYKGLKLMWNCLSWQKIQVPPSPI